MALGDLKRKGILFGCDNWGTVVDEEMPYKNDEGIEMKKYLISPSTDLMDAYPELKRPGILNIKTPVGMAIWVEYPTYWVCDENPSRKNAIARIECGFDGRETPLTKRKIRLTEQLKNIQMENESLRINALVQEEEKMALLNDNLQYAQKIAELNSIMKGSKGGGTAEDNYMPLENAGSS